MWSPRRLGNSGSPPAIAASPALCWLPPAVRSQLLELSLVLVWKVETGMGFSEAVFLWKVSDSVRDQILGLHILFWWQKWWGRDGER